MERETQLQAQLQGIRDAHQAARASNVRERAEGGEQGGRGAGLFGVVRQKLRYLLKAAGRS